MTRPAAALVAQLEAERLRQGLTVAAWSQRSGVQRDSYHRAARGGNTKVSTLALLGAALGLELTFVRSTSTEGETQQ